MNVTTNRKDLLRHVARAASVADRRGTMPVLGCVLLRYQGGTLTVSATDLYLSMVGRLGADGSAPGAVALNARDFLDRVVSCAVEPVGPGRAAYGALLSPQGKILSDFVCFGVATGFVLWTFVLHDLRSFGWIIVLTLACAMALRLARFNVMIDDPTKPAWHADFFVGMPAPAGAVTVLLPLYLNLSVLELPATRGLAIFNIFYVIAIALLMASRIPHFSGKRIGRIPRDLVIPVLFGVGATILLLAIFPMELLAVVSLAFLAMIPFSVKHYNRLAKAEANKTIG